MAPKMHVGAQDMNLTESELQFLVRHGVTHADFYVVRLCDSSDPTRLLTDRRAAAHPAGQDDMEYETLAAARAKAAGYGVSLEMIHIDPCAPPPSPSLPASAAAVKT